MSEARPSVPFSELVATGALAGAMAAGVTGVLDGLWTWGRLDQFLAGVGGKLRLLLYLAASHALVGMIAGAATAAVIGFYLRATRLGDLYRHALDHHQLARARDPREAVAGVALALAFVPIAAATLFITHGVLLEQVGARKHAGLVLAVTMGGTVAALVLA